MPDEHNWSAKRTWHYLILSYISVIENALCTQTWDWTDQWLPLRTPCTVGLGLNWPVIVTENAYRAEPARDCVLRSAAELARDCHWERLVYSGLGGWTDPRLSLRMSCVLRPGTEPTRDCHWECLVYSDLGLNWPEIVIENVLFTQTWGWTDPRLSLRRSCLLRPGVEPTRDCPWECPVHSDMGLNRPVIVIENILSTQCWNFYTIYI